jgi:hypothetical protein
MTTDDREALSRLLDGDLLPAQAQALRERIACEPDLAAAWETMQVLPRALHDLPDERPPVWLDARVLGEPRRSAWPRWPAAVVAAAAALWIVWPHPTTITLEAGKEMIDGEALVLAGPYTVEIDGRAEVVVEPASPVVRGGGQEASMSIPTHAGAVAFGAAVTVTVFQGVATVSGPDLPGHEIVVHPGESHHVGRSVPEPRSVVAVTPAPDEATKAKIDGSDPVVQARIRALEDEVSKLRFEQAVARGRIEQNEGRPIPFPADLPASARPQAFEQTVHDTFGGDPNIDVLGVDCDEFPCMVSLRLKQPGDSPSKMLNEKVHALGQTVYGGDTHDMVALAVSDEGPAYATFASVPADGEDEMDPDLSTRMRWRMDGQMQSARDDEGGH